MNTSGLYVHFPFCSRVCHYCHFFKIPYEKETAERYLAALLQEIALRRSDSSPVDTVYFGGGSPALLGVPALARIWNALQDAFAIAGPPEFTIELNPEDLDVVSLPDLRQLGINRLSIGVQSFSPRDLAWLGRRHDAARAEQVIDLARSAGFDNLNLDFMIGLPGQTIRSLHRNFSQADHLGVDHVSVYLLEDETAVLSEPQERRHLRHYEFSRLMLTGSGFRHYEVSNFCRPGKHSRHNMKYWRCRPYIGLGAGASGYEDHRDYRVTTDLPHYLADLNSGRLPAIETTRFDPGIRRLVTGLRLMEGVGEGAFSPFPKARDFLLAEGFLQKKGRCLAVPPHKILLLNEILSVFL